MLNIHLILYWVLMAVSSVVSTWGTFVTLPYEHLGQWDAIKMALPYAWADWVFLTLAINIGKEHDIATPLQMKFGITMLKFFLIMAFTKYYLHDKVSRSDMIGFVIVVLAYFLNIFNGVSIMLGRPVVSEEKAKDKKDDTATKEQTKQTEQTQEKDNKLN